MQQRAMLRLFDNTVLLVLLDKGEQCRKLSLGETG